MMDETIAPTLYRCSPVDRRIPLGIGLTLALSAPLVAWASGPFLWPWGWGAAFAATLGAVGALGRWWNARLSVLFCESEGAIGFRNARLKMVALGSLTRVSVRPSAARTTLWSGKRRHVISHRLLRAGELLDRLRSHRPELFPSPSDRLLFRRSSATAVFQTILAVGTGVSGWLLAGWQPWVGGFFEVAAVYIALRVLVFVPRAYVVVPGSLTTHYWLRHKRWVSPTSLREEGFAAGGVVFYRMRLEFGRWQVVLDESQLRDPLRPLAGLVISHLGAHRS